MHLMDDEGMVALREQRVTVLKEITNLDHLTQVDLA